MPYSSTWERAAVGRLRKSFQAMGFDFEYARLAAYVRHLYDRADRILLTAAGGAGIAELHELGWDSSIYGRRIAAVGLLALDPDLARVRYEAMARSITVEINAAARERGVQMLVARFEAEELWWAHALEAESFHTMDVQSPLFLRPRGRSAAAAQSSFGIRDVREADIPEVVSFAKSVFSRSHLYADPALPVEDGDRLHEEWVRNTCRGRAWFSLVAEDGDGLCGLISGMWDDTQKELLGLGHGHIDLLAVKDDRRGRGLGNSLIAAALDRYATRDADLVTISTQSTNLPAIRLYLRSGFQLAGPQITLHGWLKSAN